MLNKEDILSVAKLARLDLADQEVDTFVGQLSNILNLFKEIDDIGLKNITETSQITGISNVAYADEVKSDPNINPSGSDENLQNTPMREGSKILTPQVIEK